MGSVGWAQATAKAFDVLRMDTCAEVAKPEWWNDEGLRALSARVMRVSPNEEGANIMRAHVMSGFGDAWEAGPRSAAELKEAAAHFDRAAALISAPLGKAQFVDLADWCRNEAEAM